MSIMDIEIKTVHVLTKDEIIDQLRIQLAGCSVAALGGTNKDSIAKPGDWGWSPAYQDVLDLRRHYDLLTNDKPKEKGDRDV